RETSSLGQGGMPQQTRCRCGLMETPRGSKKTQSLDRSQPLRQGPESRNCWHRSLPSSRRALRRAASDGAARPGGAALPVEAAALPLEEVRHSLPSQQGPQEDPKKDKMPSWLKAVVNFLLMRTGLEEPTEKARRRPKGTEEPTEPREEPAIRMKAQDKRTSQRKRGHGKPGAEEPKGVQGLGARGQEDALPTLPMATCAKEMDLGLARRGRPRLELPHTARIEGGDAGPSDGSSQAVGPSSEEDLGKPDPDEVIRRIVELLKKAGDHLEEEQGQAPLREVTSQNPTPGSRRKSQEKRSSLKKAFSFRKPGLEELRRTGPADAPSPETRPPKRPGFLPLCVGGHRTCSTSSSSEAPSLHEVLSPDDDGPRPSERPTQGGCQRPSELPDRASESSECPVSWGNLPPRVQEAEVALESLAPACRRKSQERKSSFRRAFSHKKHSSKESKRMEAAEASRSVGPEARPPRKHSFLPLCVGGHRASVPSSDPEDLEFREPAAALGAQAAAGLEAASPAGSHTPDEEPWLEGAPESKELMIHRLVALLLEVDGELGNQIRRHPSFKRFLYKFSDASLRKLVTVLYEQKARVPKGDGSLANSPSPCAFGLLNKFSGSHGCAICSLMRSRGQYSGHSYAHFLSRKTQLDRQSPD
uniref:BCL2 interacting protein 5 n=1 Tax=Jaculus jaculus TaxID=51337 RepID=A0A8C5KHR3_JACJA